MKKLLAFGLAAMLILVSGCSSPETVFISNSDDLVGKSIGVQTGTTGDLEASKITDANVVQFKKGVDAAVELKNKKIDAVIIDALPAAKIVAQNPDLVILDEELTKEEYAIAVKKGNVELLDTINATLEEIKTNGTYDDFVKAFMNPDGDNVPLPERAPSEFTDVLKMGTNAAFEPFEFKKGDKVIGFDVEVAEEIAKKAGKKLEVLDMDFDGLLMALQNGTVDMVVAGMTVTDERRASVDFSDAYFDASQVVIVRKSSLK